MYCIACSFVVERYGTNNEDFRELYGNCIKNFSTTSRSISSTFEVEIVLSVVESLQRQQLSHCLGVLTF